MFFSDHKLQQLEKNQRMVTSLCFVFAAQTNQNLTLSLSRTCYMSVCKARDERLSQRKFAWRPSVKGQLPGRSQSLHQICGTRSNVKISSSIWCSYQPWNIFEHHQGAVWSVWKE